MAEWAVMYFIMLSDMRSQSWQELFGVLGSLVYD